MSGMHRRSVPKKRLISILIRHPMLSSRSIYISDILLAFEQWLKTQSR